MNIILRLKHAKHKKEFSYTPLKHFLKCNTCGTSFTGYEVKKKGLHYYKCNRLGCKCNRNAKHLHNKFTTFLNRYKISDTLIEPLKQELLFRYNELNKNNQEESKQIKDQLIHIENKISQLEQRYVYGEIPKELYDKYIFKLKEERGEIRQKLEEVNFQLSNPEEYIDFSIKLASNLSKIWDSNDYSIKEELQYLMFPKDIAYDKEKDDYRTIEENSIFAEIALIKGDSEDGKKEKTDTNIRFSNWVGPLGIEPSTHRL